MNSIDKLPPPEAPKTIEENPNDFDQRHQQAAELIFHAKSKEDLSRAYALLDKEEVSDEELGDLLAMRPEERFAAVFLDYKEATSQDSQHAERLGMSVEDYMTHKAFLKRLDLDSFEKTESGQRLTIPELERSHAKRKSVAGFVNKEELKELTPEQLEKLNQALARSDRVEKAVIDLGENEEAQEEMYGLIRRREVGVMSEEALVEETVVLSEKHDLIPQQAQEQERKDQEEVTEKEKEQVVESLGIAREEIVGKDDDGHVLIQAGRAQCGYDPETAQINWIKIDILGDEFLYEPKAVQMTPQSFQREVGLAYGKAIFQRFRLPFEGPEQERSIEIFLHETGDIHEFTYDQLDSRHAEELIRFLTALTPPRITQEGKTPAQIFRQLGILSDDNRVNYERLRAIAQEWMRFKKTHPESRFLAHLLSNGTS